MAQGDQYDIGELVGTIQFDLPEQEKAKLDTMADQSNELKGAFSAFRKGGSAIFAAFSAVALLFGAGGFRTIIDLLFETVRLLAAVIASPIVDALRLAVGETQTEAEDIEEKGFFTPDRLASLFFGALAAAALALAGAPAWLTVGGALATAWLSAIIDHKLWTGVKQIVAGLGKVFWGLVTDNLSMFKSGLKNIWDGLKNIASFIFNLLPESVKDWGRQLWQGTKEAAAATVAVIKGWGRIIWNGLKNAAAATADWVKNLGQGIADWFVSAMFSVDWSELFDFLPGVGGGGGGGGSGHTHNWNSMGFMERAEHATHGHFPG